jgi:hypothetical protein
MALFALVATGAVLGLDACSGDDDAPETQADVLARGGSIATVTIAEATYDFEVTCYDAGAGSVIAVGTGTVPDPSGEARESRVFVQASLGDPYIGVTVEQSDPEDEDGAASEEVFEAAIDESFDLLLEDDVVAAGEIEFVRNMDLTTGEGEPAGVGSVRVTCGGYEQGGPPGIER